ncbi:MAG: hypothetical protein HYY93_04305 [Planctomycetes bacterium]|nr:hypothetical protein [Planctomycetota bacterium]
MPDPISPASGPSGTPPAADPAAALNALLRRTPTGSTLEGQVREVLGPNRYLVAIGGQTVALEVPATLAPLQQFVLRVVSGTVGGTVLELLTSSGSAAGNSAGPPLPAAILAPSLLEALPTSSPGVPSESVDLAARTEAILRRFGLASTPENFGPVSAALRASPPGGDPAARAAATAYLLSRHVVPQPALVAAVASLTENPAALGPLVERIQSLAARLVRTPGGPEGSGAGPVPSEAPVSSSPSGPTGTGPFEAARTRPALAPALPAALSVGETAEAANLIRVVEAATAPLSLPKVAEAEPLVRGLLESSPQLRAIDLVLEAMLRLNLTGESGAATAAALVDRAESGEVARLVGLLERIAKGPPTVVAASIESELVPALRAATAQVRAGFRQAVELLEAAAIREHPALQALQSIFRDGAAVAERMATLRLTSGLDTVRGEPTVRVEVPLLVDGRPATALLEVREREGRGGGRREAAPVAANVFLALELSQIGWVTVQVEGEKKTATARFRVRDARVRRLLWRNRKELTEAVGRIGLALNMDVAVQAAGESMPGWGPAAPGDRTPPAPGVDLKV